MITARALKTGYKAIQGYGNIAKMQLNNIVAICHVAHNEGFIVNYHRIWCS